MKAKSAALKSSQHAAERRPHISLISAIGAEQWESGGMKGRGRCFGYGSVYIGMHHICVHINRSEEEDSGLLPKALEIFFFFF